MVSAKALASGNDKTLRLLDKDPREVPVSAQVFGSDADALAGAAQRVADLGFDIVDVNMGCPVPKITSGGAGCALMTRPADAARLLEKMVRSSPIPVTAKIRAGWDDEHKNAPDVARALESAGVAALTVHGRTRAQLYSGRADRVLIGEVKHRVSIPVFGNGDVDSPDEALDMIAASGVDGIAIGRGALGRPWVFAQIARALEGAEPPLPPSPAEVGRLVLELMEGVVVLYGESLGMRMMRRLASDFSKGLPGGARFREGCIRLTTRGDLAELVKAHLGYNGPAPVSPVDPPVGGPLPPPEPGGG
jgi:tRNA-dihydrouridine synthase B